MTAATPADTGPLVDVHATITLSDAEVLPSLAAALDGGECTVVRTAADSLELAFPWGAPAAGELAHAWGEVVFFLATWQAAHPGVTIDVADVRFAPRREREPNPAPN